MTITNDRPQAAAKGPFYATVETAEAFGRRLLLAHGLPEQDANTVASCLVRADLRGVDTHGLQYLPHYLERVRRGLINPKPELKVERVTPMVGALDGQNGFGFVVAKKAMAVAIELAREFGVGIVTARRSTHFGMAANYTLQALDAGYHRHRADQRLAGNAALGRHGADHRHQPDCGVRAGGQGNSLRPRHVAGGGGARQSASRGAARRKSFRSAMRSTPRAGRPPIPTLRSTAASCSRSAGRKAQALSMLMDVLCGVITGAGCAGDVGNQFLDFERPQNVGHFLLAMKPDLFISKDEYLARMDRLAQRVHGCALAEGFSEVIMPGERERRFEAKYRRIGVPYGIKELAELQKEAAKAGLPPLPVSETPLADAS